MKTQNTLKLAIRTAAAATALGFAGQASAVDLNVSDDAEVSLYGYARLNMSYDFDGDNAVSTRAGTFDMEDTGKTHFGADAYQSRLGVKVNHASGASVTVEGDFRGGAGGDLRLRHAFGEYRGFLAGRTWSNYNSFVGATPTLDFDSLAGLAGLQDRTEQVRYTTGPLSFAIEDSVGEPIIAGETKTRQAAPVLTARVEDSAGTVSYSAAALAKRVNADGANSDDSATGYGVFGAMTLDLTDMLSVHGAVNFTDGANSYLYRSGNNFYGTSAYVKGGGDIETVQGYGGSLGTSLDLGNGNSINLGYGMTRLDLDDAIADGPMTSTAAETNQNAMLNYQWTPLNNVMLGVEYGYYNQETEGGDTTESNRLLFATQYDF